MTIIQGLSAPLLDLSRGMTGPSMRNNIEEFNNMFRLFQSVMSGKNLEGVLSTEDTHL